MQELKEDAATWNAVADDVKSNILRFEAGLELEVTGDVERAIALADEALAVNPHDDQTRLRALIAYTNDGPEAGLVTLRDTKSDDDLNLKAALLLESGRPEECLSVASVTADAKEPNPEGLRVRSLAHLAMKDTAQARLDIQRALEIAPNVLAMRLTGAIVNYYSSFSPAALQGRIDRWPQPNDWSVIRRDQDSVERIRAAGDTFRQFAEAPRSDPTEKELHEVWRLACLANDPDRQAEAVEFCSDLLAKNPANYRVLSWALSRNYDVDLRKSIYALSTRVTKGSLELGEILGLVSCHVAATKPAAALKVLANTRKVFKTLGADSLWCLWQAQTLVSAGKVSQALKLINNSAFRQNLRHVKAIALHAIAGKTDNWQPLVDYLKTCFDETADPAFLYNCCEVSAQNDDWAFVADHANHLVDRLGTAGFVTSLRQSPLLPSRYSLTLEKCSRH